MSLWSWNDGSPLTNSLLQWMLSEPSDIGICGYLSELSILGLKAASCHSPLNGSICERPINHGTKQCWESCALWTTCRECSTKSQGLSCGNIKQCVDFSAYVTSFPFRQCTEGYLLDSCPPENCSGYYMYSYCLEQPGGGWCTDPNNTGKGKFIEGSYRRPMSIPSQSSTGTVYPQPLLNSCMCLEGSRYNWSFIHYSLPVQWPQQVYQPECL